MSGWEPRKIDECPAGLALGYDYGLKEECQWCGIQFRLDCIKKLKELGEKAKEKPNG